MLYTEMILRKMLKKKYLYGFYKFLFDINIYKKFESENSLIF